MTLTRIKKRIIPILKEYDVRSALVFGSFAYGRAGRASDLDLIVEFAGKKSLLDMVSLKLKLEETIKRGVDILTPNSIHPLIKKQITKKTVRVI